MADNIDRQRERRTRERVAHLVHELGGSAAARALGMRLEAVLGLAAGAGSHAGTIVLAEERLDALERAAPHAPDPGERRGAGSTPPQMGAPSR